jgi:SAM-dependent methyltransferase/uncharacterized protein YbaR (Trm112 family)
MNIECLKFLACPACHAQIECRQDGQQINTMFAVGAQGDLIEGELNCLSCGSFFPVLCGVAILVDHLNDYLLNHAAEIAIFGSQWGLSRAALGWLVSQTGSYMSSDYRTTSWDSLSSLNMYIGMHYLDPSSLPFSDVRTAEAFRTLSDGSFYAKLADLVPTGRNSSGVLLDIGCNVGGLLFRTQTNYRYKLGVDLSFGAALYARAILLESPRPLRTCTIRTEVDGLAELSLDSVTKQSQIEVVVGRCETLPVAAGSVETVCATNVLEILGEPRRLLDEMDRVVSSNGWLVHTSPYYWRADRNSVSRWLGTGGLSTGTYLMEWLISRGYALSQPQELPWLLRHYNRYFQYYMVQVLLGTKSTVAGP